MVVISATITVFLKPKIISGELINSTYHLVLNPLQVKGASEALNDIKITTAIGRYKNIKIKISENFSQRGFLTI
jgi:hypothetical protein